jgi:4-carboxymuconolactone decarboxylase
MSLRQREEIQEVLREVNRTMAALPHDTEIGNCPFRKGGTHMTSEKMPTHYESLKSRFPKVMEALENLGHAIRAEGPLDLKTGHLIQLAAAAVSQSEGGASPEEIYHTLILLLSPIGFPKVAAAISWAEDMMKK